jgi:hypothetical protein
MTMAMKKPMHAETLVPNAFFVCRALLSHEDAEARGADVVSETFDKCSPQPGFGHIRRWIDYDHLLGRFGLPGVTYSYKGAMKQVHPLTPTLRDLLGVVSSTLDHQFNCVVVNYYLNGQTSLYPHSDKQYIPQLGPEPVIATLSLGAKRPMIIKHNKTQRELVVELNNGDLFVMHGESQDCWKHGLPVVSGLAKARISLTFQLHDA